MTSVSTRRVKALPIIIWGYIIWSLVPVLIAVIYSFNDGRSRTVWKGFSFRWWFGDKYASVFHDPSMRHAIVNSLVLAVTTMLIVTPLGLALAIGSHRMKGKSAAAVQGMTSVPLITPEIVVGAALLLTFTRLFSGIPLGYPAQLLGNVTFSVSAVVVIVHAWCQLVPVSKKPHETLAPHVFKPCALCSCQCSGLRSWPVSWSYLQPLLTTS
jgi:spermidine/putrescine transport system permease protein